MNRDRFITNQDNNIGVLLARYSLGMAILMVKFDSGFNTTPSGNFRLKLRFDWGDTIATDVNGPR